MTAHELSNYLLTQPDLPVFINGWGSDEGVTCEVTKVFIIEDKNGSAKAIHLDYDEIDWG